MTLKFLLLDVIILLKRIVNLISFFSMTNQATHPELMSAEVGRMFQFEALSKYLLR